VPGCTLISEPMLCGADGEPSRAGALDLPTRLDLVLHSEYQDDQSLEITTESAIDFAPLTYSWNDAVEVAVEPFHWERCAVVLRGTFSDDWWPLLEWFNKWFDEFDSKASLKRDVQEVVHFLSDPEVAADHVRFTLDFGTAPVGAFDELLDAVHKCGAESAHFSSVPRA
jgi:hypothetical protein